MILQRPAGRLCYETYGSGDTIVYLNGFASGISTWYPVIKGLKKRYQNVVYDYPGTGDSECGEGYRFCFDAYCDDLNALIDRLGAPAVHLVGYSMGGWIAQEFAGRYPERVTSLALVNSSSRIFSQQHWIISHFIEVLRDSEVSVFSKLMFISYYSPEYFESNRENLERIKDLANRYFEKQRPDTWTALLRSCLDFDAESHLRALPMPVLVVSGEHDFLCPRMTARRFGELIPDLHWSEFAAVGHAIPMERHRQLGAAIDGFLAARFLAGSTGTG